MKRLLAAAALAVLTLPSVALAGTAHMYFDSTSFRVVQKNADAACAQSDTFSEFADGTFAYPDGLGNYVWAFGAPTGTSAPTHNCVVNVPFTMPPSNTGATVTVRVFMNTLNDATTNKTCFRTAYEVFDTQESAGTGPTSGTITAGAYVNGYTRALAQSTYQSIGIAPIAGAASTDIMGTSNAITAEQVQGTSSQQACSSTSCSGYKGYVSLERCKCGTDTGCTGTDNGSRILVWGIDVQWPTI